MDDLPPPDVRGHRDAIRHAGHALVHAPGRRHARTPVLPATNRGDLDFYGTYAALRFGIIISRTQRRAISFGEAELPDDPDDLLSNRHPLEAMVEGSYWEQFSGSR